MIPLCHELGTSSDKIIGVHLYWEVDGKFHSIEHDMPINHSKWQAAQSLSSRWLRPAVARGMG